MPRSAITEQTIDIEGLEPAYEAANVDGNSLVNNGRRFVHVKTGATPITVTIPTPATTGEGLDIEDQQVAVPANEDRMIGPFRTPFNQTDGTVHVDYDAVTSVTVAVLELP